MKAKTLNESITEEIDREIFHEIFVMYSGISEKSARQFEKFCHDNDWLFPSGIKVSIMSGEAERDWQGRHGFPSPYEDAIKLAQFNWSGKTKAHRLKNYPNNRRGYGGDGVEFQDYGYILIRSLRSKEDLQSNQRTIELIFKAFLAGAGARTHGLKKTVMW